MKCNIDFKYYQENPYLGFYSFKEAQTNENSAVLRKKTKTEWLELIELSFGGLDFFI